MTEERIRIPSKTTIREMVDYTRKCPVQVKIYEYQSEAEKSKKKKKVKKQKNAVEAQKEKSSNEYLSMELKSLSTELKRKSSVDSIASQTSDFRQTMDHLSSIDKTTAGETPKVDVSIITECKFQDVSLVSAELAIEMSGLKAFFDYFKENTKEHIQAILTRLDEVEKKCKTFGLFELSTRLERSISFFRRDTAKLDTITSETFRLRRKTQLDECIRLFLVIANIADVIY